jgi:hypothetical protein
MNVVATAGIETFPQNTPVRKLVGGALKAISGNRRQLSFILTHSQL